MSNHPRTLTICLIIFIGIMSAYCCLLANEFNNAKMTLKQQGLYHEHKSVLR